MTDAQLLAKFEELATELKRRGFITPSYWDRLAGIVESISRSIHKKSRMK